MHTVLFFFWIMYLTPLFCFAVAPELLWYLASSPIHAKSFEDCIVYVFFLVELGNTISL